MYYNLTEDEKVFYETSYSLLKAGYTNEEIVEFWSNDNEEEVEFILESLEYVDINRKDPDFIELNESWIKAIQTGLQYGSRAWQGLKTAAKFVANPITRNLALRSRNAARIKELAALSNPTRAQQGIYNTLAKRYPNVAKNNPTKWQTDKLTQVRPGSAGSSTYRPTPEPTPVATPAPVAPAVKPPRNPIITKQNLKIGAKTAVGLGAATGIVLGSDKATPFVKDVLDTAFPIPPDKPQVGTDKSKVKTDKPQVETDKPQVETEKPRVETEKPRVETEKPQVETEKPRVETEKPQRLPVQNYEPPSRPTDSSRQNSPESRPQSRDYEQERNKRRDAIRQYSRSISSPTPGVSRRGVTGSVNNSYEYVIDKLIAEGHASSIEEAEYVFKQLDEDFIKSII